MRRQVSKEVRIEQLKSSIKRGKTQARQFGNGGTVCLTVGIILLILGLVAMVMLVFSNEIGIAIELTLGTLAISFGFVITTVGIVLTCLSRSAKGRAETYQEELKKLETNSTQDTIDPEQEVID